MNRSKTIALGGISAALCSVMLIASGWLGFGQYFSALLSGLIILMVSYKTGIAASACSYIAAAVLGALLSSDRSGVLLYIFLLGYYPCLSSFLRVKCPKAVIIPIKLIVCIISGSGYYFTAAYVLGLKLLFFDGIFVTAAAAVIYIVLFFVFDFMLGRFEREYRQQITDFLDKIIK